MDKNELQIGKPPVICYLHHAYPLTAAMAHKDFNAWFFSNYIQLEYNVDCNEINFLTCMICGNCIYVPILDYRILDLEFLHTCRTDIIDFVINSIDMGYYITTYLDEFFIPDRISYKKMHNRHDIMIFGYDSKEKLFKVVGYNCNRSYSVSNISFSEFNDAYINSISKKNDVILFKAKDNLSYQPSFEFDIKNVKYLLEDYVKSYDTSDKLRMLNNPKSSYVYGIQAYKEIIKYYKSEKSNEQCDIRVPYLLWEHKKAMVSRIEYLSEKGYIEDSDRLLDMYTELRDTAQGIINMILKYYYSRDNKNLFAAAIESLEKMYSIDAMATEDLLNRLAHF